MRVIAGSHRGRRLQSLPGHRIRPTADRVRQATCNALESRGLLRDADVLDLFAGTGAMGIEALSRGAADVTFVDADARAAKLVKANLAALDLRGRVAHSDAFAFLAHGTQRFDVAFCDPPYDFARWDDLLAVLPADHVVIESDHEIALPPPWEPVREQRYGRTIVVVAARVAAPAEAPGAPEPEGGGTVGSPEEGLAS